MRVDGVSRMLGLADLLQRKPSALSGGQRQRVAMGRAIVREPIAFLMDEPLSNLDAKLRVTMRAELARLHARLRTTTIYVTHDQTEAMTLGERVAVMRDGRFQQVDAPQRLYREPKNVFVATFIGAPSMNLVTANMCNDGAAVSFGGLTMPLARDRRPRHSGPQVILGIRAEAFEDAAVADRDAPQFEVEVSVLEELGSDVYVVFPVDAKRVNIGITADVSEELALLADEGSLFTARVSPRTDARRGGTMRLSVGSRNVSFLRLSKRA